MKRLLIIVALLVPIFKANSQNNEDRLPIIDMHVHANSISDIGPPCDPPKELPYNDPSSNCLKTFTDWYTNPKYKNPASTDNELMDQTLDILKRRNIYAMVCGKFVDDYIANGRQRIIPGLNFSNTNGSSPEKIKKLLSSGKYKVFGEIGIQYAGISPSDSTFEPYLKVAEDLDIPVGIHIGPGPPGAPYFPGLGKYRERLHSSLVMEEALIRHPKLRIYIMHAGWPMIDDLITILWVYPQVYVDVGLICYAIPRPEFYAYLKRIIEAGFGKRVMYGSDQMNWPCSIEAGIAAIEQAEFLSKDQKRDILYNNAARFLRLSTEEIERQHSKY